MLDPGTRIRGKRLNLPKVTLMNVFSLKGIFILKYIIRYFCRGSILEAVFYITVSRGTQFSWKSGHRSQGSRSEYEPLFGDFNTSSGPKNTLNITVDSKLSGSNGTDHEKTGSDTTVRAANAELLSDFDEAADRAFTWCALGLIDFGQHCISRLGDDSGSKTGNQTGAKVDSGLGTIGESLLVDPGEDSLGDLLEDNELGHSVGDPVSRSISWNSNTSMGVILLKQNRPESGVERANALLLHNATHRREQTVSESGLRDQTNTSGLQGAERNVCEEFGSTGGREVDRGTIVLRLLVANSVDRLLLEEFVTSELESALEEVAGGGGTEACQQRTGALILDDLAEATEHATVIGNRVELYASFDTVVDDHW